MVDENPMPDQNLKVQDQQSFPFVLIPKEFFTRFTPTWKAILAYVALKYYASTTSGACQNVSIRTLAARGGVSEDTMRRGVGELVRKGAVTVRKRSQKSSAGERIPQPNLYTLVNLKPKGGEPV
jgi:hypothetical protein